MTDLTDREREAVERAKAWIDTPTSPAERRILFPLEETDLWHAASYACGYLAARAEADAEIERLKRDHEDERFTRMDKIEARTGGRSVDEVLEDEATLRAELEKLRARRVKLPKEQMTPCGYPEATADADGFNRCLEYVTDALKEAGIQVNEA